MTKLSDADAIKSTGGAKISGMGIFIVSVISSFIFGIIDGFSNPKACNIR